MTPESSPRLVSLQAVIGLLLAGLIGLLTGCGSVDGAPRQTSSHVTSSPDGRSELATMLRRLATAVQQRDRPACDALVSDRDSGFDSTATMILDNLLAIKPTAFTLQPTGQQRSLAAERAGLLGDRAYAAEVRVGWAVPGDRNPSNQTVWLTVVPDNDGLEWAGTTDGPDGDRPTPLWWLEPVHYQHDQHATVIAGASVDTADWLGRADKAVRAVEHRLAGPSSPAAHWNRQLVVIIPSNETLLEQMLGVRHGAETGLAAITWPDADAVAKAPMRVMINPASTESKLGAAIVLTHETVHVATASPASPAPPWLVEGLADYVAYDAYPGARDSAADALLDRVEKSGPPAELPDQESFRSTGGRLELAYAEAWLACYQLGQRYGRDDLLAFYSAVDRSPTGAVGPAARSALGIGQDQLLAGWRSFLQQAAARGSI